MNAGPSTSSLESVGHAALAQLQPQLVAQIHQVVQQLVLATLERIRHAEPITAAPAAGCTDATDRARLSEREHEVLQHIAAGDSNKVIARTLGLSPHTVKRHVANILDKTDACSRGQAAAWLRAH